MRKISIVILAALILPVSCKTFKLGFKTFDIHGMIYDFSNRPVAHCEISLEKKYIISSDINGRFTLPKVAAGTYTITGYKKGFEIYSSEVSIRGKGEIIYIRLPSQNQLLNLLDEALTANDLTAAEELAERSYQIDENNLETLFYYAAVKFRQKDYSKALSFLEKARQLGSKDPYIDKFITVLKEIRYAN